MTKIVARDTGHTLIRVLNHTVISVMSLSIEVISNSILTVLRHYLISMTIKLS